MSRVDYTSARSVLAADTRWDDFGQLWLAIGYRMLRAPRGIVVLAVAPVQVERVA